VIAAPHAADVQIFVVEQSGRFLTSFATGRFVVEIQLLTTQFAVQLRDPLNSHMCRLLRLLSCGLPNAKCATRNFLFLAWLP
jgi:hypothetical protein